jgi:hypothetical protein
VVALLVEIVVIPVVGKVPVFRATMPSVERTLVLGGLFISHVEMMELRTGGIQYGLREGQSR